MDIQHYLARIGYDGSLEPDVDTLTKLHRAHLFTIPYENLDIHLGRTLSLNMEEIFDKLVTRGRGGWCYEMNGLLAWALQQLGFSVTLLASAVNRAANGDRAERNHLILLAHLDRPYLVDVGFGNGLLEPIPLESGTYTQQFLTYTLSYDNVRWHFQNHAYGGPGFDFDLTSYQMDDFSDKCFELQTAPDSGFVRTTVCYRFTRDGYISLKGVTLTTYTVAGSTEQLLDNAAAYATALREQFNLPLPSEDVATLWSKGWTRHLESMSARP